jgi:hypothetical protein
MKDTSHEKDPNGKPAPPRESLPAQQADKSDLEEEKLKLEIVELRKKNKWWAQPIFATGVGVIVGVLGLFLTVVQFESQRTSEQDRTIIEQQRDRTIRFQNQIRADIDEILRFTRDQTQTVSRVSFLLEDIKTVMQSQVNDKQKVSDLFPGYERRLSESLVFLVRDDCDFTRNPRDVELANMVVGRWYDYSAYLKEDPEKFDYILYEYIRALEYLRQQNPGYFDDMSLSEEKTDYIVTPRYQRQKNESILYSHFLDIVDGVQDAHRDIRYGHPE